MNKNEKFVITINRELGSGGRTVGRLLAEKLGVPFYDKAVIKTLQEKYHISPEEIERLKGRKHSWWADVERILKIDSGMSMDYYMPKKGDAPDLVTTDEMFKTETLILQDLAAGESCVVAGRSGFHVFRLHPNRGGPQDHRARGQDARELREEVHRHLALRHPQLPARHLRRRQN